MSVNSATTIDPALQSLDVGDRIRYTPQGYQLDMEYRVVRVDPPHLLVLVTPDDVAPATSITSLVAGTAGGSRILLRWRSASGGVIDEAINHVLAPVAWAMERKQLVTIAERAEQSACCLEDSFRSGVPR